MCCSIVVTVVGTLFEKEERGSCLVIHISISTVSYLGIKLNYMIDLTLHKDRADELKLALLLSPNHAY